VYTVYDRMYTLILHMHNDIMYDYNVHNTLHTLYVYGMYSAVYTVYDRMYTLIPHMHTA
jgi:hypothetical protein